MGKPGSWCIAINVRTNGIGMSMAYIALGVNLILLRW